jgi:trigger factor
MIDARIAQDQEKVSRTVDVEDRPVQNGDTVNLNYAGTVDGVAFDGGTAENQTLTIGSNQFIPGFEEQMIGMNIGEEKDLNVTFPAQYHAENLAGKDAVFHVKVNSIQATEKPALDDDFAADVSEFNTFAEYRENVVKELTKQVEESNANAIENAVMEKAVANAQMDVPAAMIDDQVDYMIQDMEMNMRYQGLKMEDFLKYTGQTLDAMKLSYRGEAERRVKTELVMEAIRKAEGAEPTEEEIEAEIKRQAESMGRDVEDFRKSLTDSQKDYLKDNAEIRKALKVMRESAKVSEPKPAEEPKAEEAAEAPKDEPKKPARRRTTKKTEKPAEEAEA